MTASINQHVARTIASLFSSGRDADMLIVFYQETGILTCEQKRLGKNASRRLVLGDPLPAHSWILRYASDRFAVEFERWGKHRPELLHTPTTPDHVPSIEDNVSTASSSVALPPDDTLVQTDVKQTPPLLRLQSAQHMGARSKTESPASCGQQQGALSAHSGLPTFFIPLGSQAEVPSARDAVRFAYTGEVTAGSICDVLGVRRQGAYLQVNGCTAACDEALVRILKGVGTPKSSSTTTSSDSSSNSTGGDVSSCHRSSHGTNSRQAGTSGFRDTGELPEAVDLYLNDALWPDVEAEPSFATVLNTAKPMLVSHFSDALKTLNTIPLKQQLLALPAVAVEALLSSDDFGTDCESTILLLLATWMEANYDKTDAESRRRLCRTVRLAFLSPPYLSLVLPALAADHEKSQDGPAGWFPVDVMQAAFIAKLTDLPEWERKELVFLSDLPAHIFVALSLSRRRMCVPTTGLVFPWHVPEQELLLLRSDAGALSPSCARATTACTFAGNVSSFMGYGFSWRLCIPLVGEDMNAALSLHCELPAALAIPGSRLSRPCGLWTHVPVTAVVRVQGRTLDAGAQQSSFQVVKKGCRGDMIWVGMRWDLALPPSAQRQQPQQQRPQLRQQQRQQQQVLQQQQVAGIGGAESRSPLAAWARYLLDCKVSGTLTLHGTP